MLFIRNFEKQQSMKSKYKASYRFLLIFGIFLFFVALFVWYITSQGSDSLHSLGPTAGIFKIVFSHFGTNGVIGLLVLIGSMAIIKAISFRRKSEQIKENNKDSH